jgi:hypothetical protein
LLVRETMMNVQVLSDCAHTFDSNVTTKELSKFTSCAVDYGREQILLLTWSVDHTSKCIQTLQTSISFLLQHFSTTFLFQSNFLTTNHQTNQIVMVWCIDVRLITSQIAHLPRCFATQKKRNKTESRHEMIGLA